MAVTVGGPERVAVPVKVPVKVSEADVVPVPLADRVTVALEVAPIDLVIDILELPVPVLVPI